MDEATIRDVLASNLTALMNNSVGLNTLEAVSNKTGMGRSTVERIKKAQVTAGIDKVAQLAKAFGVSPAQLLEPGGVRESLKLDDHAKKIIDMMATTDEWGKMKILTAAKSAADEHHRQNSSSDEVTLERLRQLIGKLG